MVSNSPTSTVRFWRFAAPGAKGSAWLRDNGLAQARFDTRRAALSALDACRALNEPPRVALPLLEAIGDGGYRCGSAEIRRVMNWYFLDGVPVAPKHGFRHRDDALMTILLFDIQRNG